MGYNTMMTIWVDRFPRVVSCSEVFIDFHAAPTCDSLVLLRLVVGKQFAPLGLADVV